MGCRKRYEQWLLLLLLIAMKALNAACFAIGLIAIRPRRGAVVVEPRPHRIYEMFDVMAELEGMAGSLAARRHTDTDRTELLAAHGRCEQSANADDADTYYYDNELFIKPSTPQAIAAFSSNSVLPCIAACALIAASSFGCAIV
jgi:DNA-binding GntR family transcriptional regulator